MQLTLPQRTYGPVGTLLILTEALVEQSLHHVLQTVLGPLLTLPEHLGQVDVLVELQSQGEVHRLVQLGHVGREGVT